MSALRFREARECVIEKVKAACPSPAVEEVRLLEAAGRVLGEDVLADQDYPPLPRSIRDGFAVRSADLPGSLTVIGEVRAGEVFSGEVARGQAVEIMTGAPVPKGADAVVMIEHVTRDGDRVFTDQVPEPGQFINPKGAEARCGERLLRARQRLDYSQIALAATVGRTSLRVYGKPRVAILPTGDEIIPVEEPALDHQVRNSNAYSLAVQVDSAGGTPEILPVAKDNHASTRELIERGLSSDVLLLSGGVSAGKYDLVEEVLGDLGAEFFFDRVLIQPGQPLVFGKVRGVFFFGLPGNPVSTMVTFKLFAGASLELLGGQADVALPIFSARLTADFRHRAGLTRFLPASLSPDGSELTPIPWQGSSDVSAVVRANSFLVADADRESWKAGDPIGVLLK